MKSVNACAYRKKLNCTGELDFALITSKMRMAGAQKNITTQKPIFHARKTYFSLNMAVFSTK